MIQGVRRPEEAQGLGLSRRLMVRVGALLKKKFEITATVLESAKPDSPLERLLLDPALLAEAETLDAGRFAELLKTHAAENAPSGLTLESGAEGRRVLCYAEELEAAGGWDAEPEAPAEAPHAETGGALAVSATGGLARTNAPGAAGANEALFSRIELDRLRLRLVTAAHAADRIEALRTLAHAPIAPQEKAELLFRALDDRDPAVRAEAVELLFVLGVADELRESLFALAQGETRARITAAHRLVKRMAGPVADLERVVAAVCAIGSLKNERDAMLVAALLELLTVTAPALAPEPPRLAELLRVVLVRIGESSGKGAAFTDSDRVLQPAQKLVRALCAAAPAIVLPLLGEERDKSAQPAVEAFLLQTMLESTPRGAPGEAELLRLCATYLARDTQEDRESRNVGMVLQQRGEAALPPLLEAFNNATPAAQKYILNLLDHLARFQNLSPEGKTAAADAVLRALDSTLRSVRMAAMTCRFVAEPRIPAAVRERIADTFLNNVWDFGFPTDREIAEDTIALIGMPAIGPLLRRINPERPPEVRVQAIRILGNLGLELKPLEGELKQASKDLTETLRRMQALASEPSFPDREALFTAMGKLVSSPAATKQAAQIVTRTLLQSVKEDLQFKRLDALEGLTWLAASRRADGELIVTVTGLLRRIIDQIQDELQTTATEVDGTQVFEINQERGLVEILPTALKGLARIATSRNCPPALIKEQIDLLTERWKRIVAGELVWGPGNQIMIVHALREIGCHATLRDEWRMQIVKALFPRVDHPPVMAALTEVLAASDSPGTGGAALAVGLQILAHRRLDGHYDEEDRPEILKALVKLICRKHLGPPDAAGQAKAQSFRETVIDDLYKGAQDTVRGAYHLLASLRDAKVLPADIQERLEQRLAQYGQLANAR